MSRNKLLGSYAVCEQLNDFRTGKQKYLNEYAQYYAPLNSIELSAPASMTKVICAKLRDRKDIDARLGKIAGDAAPKVREIVGMEFGDTRSLGVLDEEPNVCYFGTVAKTRTEFGEQKITLSITASTVIKGKLLTYGVFAPYVDETSVPILLKKQKENVHELAISNVR